MRKLHEADCIKNNFNDCDCADEVDFSSASLVQDGCNTCLFKCVRKLDTDLFNDDFTVKNNEEEFTSDVDFKARSNLPGFLQEEFDRKDLNIMIPSVINNKEKIYGVADCCSMVSCISPELVKKLKLKISRKTGHLRMAHRNNFVERRGIVSVLLSIGSHTHQVELEVLDTGDDMLLGLDLFPKFGIRIEGVPVDFPDGDRKRDGLHILSDDIGEDDGVVLKDCDRVDEKLLNEIMSECADALEANKKIPVRHFCTHPAAEVSLDTGDAPPVYRRQYPVSRNYEKFIDEQVRTWFNDGVTERGSARSRYNSQCLSAMSLTALRKRDVV